LAPEWTPTYVATIVK